MGFVNVLQAGKPSSFEETLHLKGADFNWVGVSVMILPPVNADYISGRIRHLFHGHGSLDPIELADEKILWEILLPSNHDPLGYSSDVHRRCQEQSRLACRPLLPRST